MLPVASPVYKHWVSGMWKYIDTVEPFVFRVKVGDLSIAVFMV
jgi:hypothetical protein